MDKNNLEKFAGLMAMLAEAFAQDDTKLRTEVYFEALKDFDIVEIEKATYLAIKTLKFYPKVAELRELIGGDPESQALIAWRTAIDTQNYYHGANFVDDPIIPYCIEELFGDYQAFCMKTLDELKWEEKRFMALYRLAQKRPDLARNTPTKMEGFYQTSNRAGGWLDHMPPVPKIESKEKKKLQITQGGPDK